MYMANWEMDKFNQQVRINKLNQYKVNNNKYANY